MKGEIMQMESQVLEKWLIGMIYSMVFQELHGMIRAGFDKDGVMYCSQAFGDYPAYLPVRPADHLQSRFTGWMLLNYNKPGL
jgi:hypothetical protein